MQPLLYALIAVFVFAIVHGMHFSIAPLPGPASYYNVRLSPVGPLENQDEKDVIGDIQRAGL